MSVLKDKYNKIISEIESKITNPEELEFIKLKISELSMAFMDAMDGLTDEIKKIEDKQEIIESKMSDVESAVNNIENDIYENEESFDFEIVCPYCNCEFVTSIEEENEIICPNCNNIIELDWNDDEEEHECEGHCSGCHGCIEEQDEEDEDM